MAGPVEATVLRQSRVLGALSAAELGQLATLMRRRKGLDDVDLCPKCQPAPKGQLY